MCDICRRYFCPPPCPSFNGRSAELGRALFRCTACKRRIFENDDYVINYGKPYCYKCLNKEWTSAKEDE